MSNFIEDQFFGGKLPEKVEEVEETKEEITEELETLENIKKDEGALTVDPDEKAKEETLKAGAGDGSPSIKTEEEAKPLVNVKEKYKEWLGENETKISEYLSNKNKDFSKLSDKDAVLAKIKKDNPDWDDADISAELTDKYGIGLDRIEIDAEEMDTEEIREAKKHNRFIEQGLRALKTDGKNAKAEFEEYKNSLEMPEFDLEVQETEKTPEGYYTPEVIQQKLANDAQEYKEKQWVPQLTETVKSIETVTHQVEIDAEGGKVALDIAYKLSDAEKQELVNHLADYSGHPSDTKYITDGTVDTKAFMQDKAAELFYKKLIQVGIQEALTKGKKDVIKNELLNFDGGGRQGRLATTADEDMTPEQRLQKAVWGSGK